MKSINVDGGIFKIGKCDFTFVRETRVWGDKCKICEKDDRLFAIHSFTNSTSKRL